ncbi:MAG: hypothetical protein A2V66_06865 [Ignavibacteria bacterium RBG_13_36_8]|nr:MAG: hypothetical protein A2V66_06865 [Ignavibacteria bacterium RBG_13_36_8]
MQYQQPELFQKIKDKVNEGRWEIVGGMWIEPDCNLPSGESWSHQLLYGQKYFEKNFGRKALIGWNPDSFGYNWNLPMFLTNSGIDVFITQKIGWNDTNVFPYRVFWWESPDKSKVLTYFPFDYVNTIENPYRLIDWLRQFESNTGFTKLLILFGVGNHGGGPSIEMMGRIDRLAQLDIFPKIEFGTAESYLNWLKSQDLSEVPTWDSELYLEYHRGTLTTQSNTKKWNRKSEALLTTTEKFSTLANSLGFTFNKTDLNDAWENVLFNQFHDILPGSSIREVYIDADKDYRESNKIGSFILDNSLDFISKQIGTDKIKNAVPIVVFNPLSWERTDVAAVQLSEGDLNDYSIFDLVGNEIPSQAVAKDKYEREVIFIADQVPALGYKTYQLKKQKPVAQNTDLKISDNSLENDLFKIIVCKKCGWVKSIFDKRNNKELLTDFGNRLQILEDKPSAWDAWNIGLTGTEYPSNFRKMEIVEQGPVRTVLRTYRDYLQPGVKKEFPTEDFPSSFFTQDIILYNRLDRIDFKTDVEWWEDKTMLKVAFPVNVTDTVATYEIPYGTIQRSTTLKAQWDKGKWEAPAHRWANVSQNDYGISLLNKAKYGYDIKGNVMRLSLLRSPKWPDPTADRGTHSIEYALYSHEGKVMESKTTQRGYEYNYPLFATMTDAHKGKLPTEYSFVEISPSNLILTSIKMAEDEDAWIIQLYETKGQDTEAILTLPNRPNKICLSNFLEEDGASLKPEVNKVMFNVSAHSVLTLKLKF